MDRRKLGTEALGTFWMVLGGCGSARSTSQAPFAGSDYLEPLLLTTSPRR